MSIKQDITKLNNQLKILQSVSKSKANSKQATDHTNSVIMSLQTKLADTSLGFKGVLESEVSLFFIVECSILIVLFQVDIQQEQSYAAPSYSPQPRRRVNANQQSTQDLYESPQSLGIPMISQQQQQVMIEQQDQRIETRSNAMETVESTIAELGSIFQQLATMVAEQRETIQRYVDIRIRYYVLKY